MFFNYFFNNERIRPYIAIMTYSIDIINLCFIKSYNNIKRKKFPLVQ